MVDSGIICLLSLLVEATVIVNVGVATDGNDGGDPGAFAFGVGSGFDGHVLGCSVHGLVGPVGALSPFGEVAVGVFVEVSMTSLFVP